MRIILMSELDTTERTPVDGAGCEFGEIERPARLCIRWGGEKQSVKLKTPSAPDGWISTEHDSVDLGEWE